MSDKKIEEAAREFWTSFDAMKRTLRSEGLEFRDSVLTAWAESLIAEAKAMILNSVVGSLRSYPNGGGDLAVMTEVSRLIAEAVAEKDREIERWKEQSEPFLQNALAIAHDKLRLANLELDRKAIRIQGLERLQSVYEEHEKDHAEAVDDCTHDEKTWTCCGACHCVAIEKRKKAEAELAEARIEIERLEKDRGLLIFERDEEHDLHKKAKAELAEARTQAAEEERNAGEWMSIALAKEAALKQARELLEQWSQTGGGGENIHADTRAFLAAHKEKE